MFSTLFRQAGHQATSFALAAMITLSMLGAVDRLAAPDHEVTAQAVDASAGQVVTITAERLARS